MLYKDKYKEYVDLLRFNNYTKHFNLLVKILTHSRLPILKNWSIFINQVQLSLLRNIVNVEKAIKEGKNRLKTACNEKDIEALNKGIKINRQLIRIFKTIADGIAWRNLQYNRPLLRLLSENDDAGYINKNDYDAFHKILTKSRRITIINDITRYLRIGDLTRILPNKKIVLLELKKKGKKIMNVLDIIEESKRHKQFFSKQKLRHYIAQFAIINNSIKIPIYKNEKIASARTLLILFTLGSIFRYDAFFAFIWLYA